MQAVPQNGSWASVSLVQRVEPVHSVAEVDWLVRDQHPHADR